MPKYNPLPPLERLNELLEVVEIPPDKYGVWSGLIWKVERKGTKGVGSVAGCKAKCTHTKERYDWVIGINGKNYQVSRIIYFMAVKKDPGNLQVDHKDQNTLNNNIKNLRLDTYGDIQNVNKSIRKDNTSSVEGIYWVEKIKKWRARVFINKKNKHLGYFTCKIEAARAVKNAWVNLGWDKLGRKLPQTDKIICECCICLSGRDTPT